MSEEWVRAGFGWKFCEKHGRYEGYFEKCPYCEKEGGRELESRKIKFSKNALIIEIEDANGYPLAYYTNVVHYFKDGKLVRIEIKYEEGKFIEMVKKSLGGKKR